MARSAQSRSSSTTYRLALAVLFTLALFTALAHAQTLTVLHNFTGGTDGEQPIAGVTLDQQGRIYGMAPYGGSHGEGAVYRLVRGGTGWVFFPIYSFGASRVDGTHSARRRCFWPGWTAVRNNQHGRDRRTMARFSPCNLRLPPVRLRCVPGPKP